MRYTPIEADFYVSNREKLGTNLLPRSVALVFSNAVLPTNADGVMGFRQNNDLFYLTGIDQEETVLFLCPNHPEAKLREVLFVRETSEKIKVWEGEKLSEEQVSKISGVQTVKWFYQLAGFLKKHVLAYQHIYVNLNEHEGANLPFETLAVTWLKNLRDNYPLHSFKRLSPLLMEQRLIKQVAEIAQVKKAVEITRKGFVRAAKFLRPHVHEFEVEAELTHELLMNRSRGHAFPPIVASGSHACVLHYITNNNSCKPGDVVLLDFGAEYGNYNADLTRCLPVSGRFSSRQKEVYNAVLRILRISTTLLKAGTTMPILTTDVHELFKAELCGLGLYKPADFVQKDKAAGLIARYFPHGISHHLGLDVHDVSDRYAPLAVGNLLTCEPGIYIPEEGIGIRLENDVLLTENGNIDLMANIPIEVEEIEDLMNAR